MYKPLSEFLKSEKYDVSSSISTFFMQGCECPKSCNGYYELDCCKGTCKTCTNNIKNVHEDILQGTEKVVSYQIYESREIEYTC